VLSVSPLHFAPPFISRDRAVSGPCHAVPRRSASPLGGHRSFSFFTVPPDPFSGYRTVVRIVPIVPDAWPLTLLFSPFSQLVDDASPVTLPSQTAIIRASLSGSSGRSLVFSKVYRFHPTDQSALSDFSFLSLFFSLPTRSSLWRMLLRFLSVRLIECPPSLRSFHLKECFFFIPPFLYGAFQPSQTD